MLEQPVPAAEPVPGASPSATLGRVLGVGAILSVGTVALSVVLILVQGTHAGQGLTPEQIWHALRAGKAAGVAGCGLILLCATPLAREVVALVLFARRGERAIAALAALVLALVALSLGLGLHS